jgi:hypothetical protein
VLVEMEDSSEIRPWVNCSLCVGSISDLIALSVVRFYNFKNKCCSCVDSCRVMEFLLLYLKI